jgi:hypothetical protein
MIKIAKDQVQIDISVHNQNPAEFWLQLSYQLNYLLRNQDEDNRIKCFAVESLIDSLSPLSIDDLNQIWEQSQRTRKTV